MKLQKKYNSTPCCPHSSFNSKEINRLKVKGWKKIFYANGYEDDYTDDPLSIMCSHTIFQLTMVQMHTHTTILFFVVSTVFSKLHGIFNTILQNRLYIR